MSIFEDISLIKESERLLKWKSLNPFISGLYKDGIVNSISRLDKSRIIITIGFTFSKFGISYKPCTISDDTVNITYTYTGISLPKVNKYIVYGYFIVDNKSLVISSASLNMLTVTDNRATSNRLDISASDNISLKTFFFKMLKQYRFKINYLLFTSDTNGESIKILKNYPDKYINIHTNEELNETQFYETLGHTKLDTRKQSAIDLMLQSILSDKDLKYINVK